MAAPYSSRTVSKNTLRNEPSIGSTPGKSYRLPNGPCRFTNLEIGGASPPRCGCQRFWDQLEYTQTISGKQLSVVTPDLAGFCHCSHHACFHELLPPRSSASQQVGASGALRGYSQRSRRGDTSFSSQFHSQNIDRHASQSHVSSFSNETDTARIHGPKITQYDVHKPLTDSSLPDTGLQDRQHQSDSVALGLPPIPSQCHLPPDISSGGVSGHSRSFQSFPGVSWNNPIEKRENEHSQQPSQADLGEVSRLQRLTSDPLLPSCVDEGSVSVQSATELVTPSPLGSQGLRLEHELRQHIVGLQSAVDDLASREGQAVASQASNTANGLLVTRSHLFCDPNVKVSASYPPEDLYDRSSTTPLNRTAVTVISATELTDQRTSSNDGNGLHLAHSTISHLQSILKHVSAHPTMSTRLQNHEQRIDLLENVSCSFASAQEVHEGLDLADERIGEVESRVEELEKVQAAMNDFSGPSSSRRRQRHYDDGDSSIVSQTSSELILAAIERTEFSSRLEILETEVSELRSSVLPSFANPWKVEVVFLPFGGSLQGIWSTLDQFPSQRSRNNSMTVDKGTQFEYSNLDGKHVQTTFEVGQLRGWEILSEDFQTLHGLMVARACGKGSKVEARLRSRGLVKTIEVMGPEARHVQAAIVMAFGDLPELLHDDSYTCNPIPDGLKCFHGLNASWIPLRKMHKDSRLQFLDPSEMITPALWNASFLSTSVAMRATGIKRLYITQSRSYIQQAVAVGSDWTWQKLRILPRVFPDASLSAEVGEGDAREACWEWDERLDPPQSAHSSFTSQHSSLSIRAAVSEHSSSSRSRESSSSALSPVVSTTPTSITHTKPISPLMERSRPLHSRTTSMPLIGPLKLSPPPGKRRITSFDHELRGPASPQSSPVRPSAGLHMKRRRISRSPSRPRDTPRWSVGPPSPYYFEESTEPKRGTTPFAYATPHSNVPYVDFRPQSVTGMTMNDHAEQGSITDELGLDDADGFASEAKYEPQLEDDDWKGIRDELCDDDSDQEQNALSIEVESDDAMSDLSSQPSEYPSTQPQAFHETKKGVFQIHVDEEENHDAYGRP